MILLHSLGKSVKSTSIGSDIGPVFTSSSLTTCRISEIQNIYSNQLQTRKSIFKIVNSYRVNTGLWLQSAYMLWSSFYSSLTMLDKECPWHVLPRMQNPNFPEKYLEIQQNMSPLVCDDSRTKSRTAWVYLQINSTNMGHAWCQNYTNVLLLPCNCVKNFCHHHDI